MLNREEMMVLIGNPDIDEPSRNLIAILLAQSLNEADLPWYNELYDTTVELFSALLLEKLSHIAETNNIEALQLALENVNKTHQAGINDAVDSFINDLTIVIWNANK